MFCLQKTFRCLPFGPLAMCISILLTTILMENNSFGQTLGFLQIVANQEISIAKYPNPIKNQFLFKVSEDFQINHTPKHIPKGAPVLAEIHIKKPKRFMRAGRIHIHFIQVNMPNGKVVRLGQKAVIKGKHIIKGDTLHLKQLGKGTVSFSRHIKVILSLTSTAMGTGGISAAISKVPLIEQMSTQAKNFTGQAMGPKSLLVIAGLGIVVIGGSIAFSAVAFTKGKEAKIDRFGKILLPMNGTAAVSEFKAMDLQKIC